MSLPGVNATGINAGDSAVSASFILGAPLLQQITGNFILGVGIQQSIYGEIPDFTNASYVRPYITLGGVVITAITSVVRVEAEEGLARTAEFSFSPATGIVDIAAWYEQTITIDYDVMSGVNVLYRSRLFTGIVIEPRFDVIRGVATMICSDNLQAMFDKMTLQQINDLTPNAVFVAPLQGDDLVGFNYLQARMESTVGSVDLSASQIPRLTLWAAKPSPDFTHTTAAEKIVDDSEQVSIANGKVATNHVEADFTYRYTRLRDRRERGVWIHGSNFCAWYVNPSDLPNREMIIQAAEQTGWILLGINFSSFLPNPQTLSPIGVVHCGGVIGDVFWFMDDIIGGQLVTRADWILGKRYAQAVEEKYLITVRAPIAQAASGDHLIKQSSGFSADYDASEWIADLETQSLQRPLRRVAGSNANHDEFVVNKDDVPGFDRSVADTALDYVVRSAKREILSAHRTSTVAWDVKLDPQIDLTQTIRLSTPRILAKGKVRRFTHEINVETGAALTTIQLAISRHAGANVTVVETTTRPPQPTVDEPTAVGISLNISRNTQLGGLISSPAWDANNDGFSGNYRSGWDGTSLREPAGVAYPVQFVVDTPEIDELTAGSQLAEANSEYLVNIPQDELQVTAP